ncbi:thioesterase II family protein [Mesorhizobium sp. 131-2-5]|uniref:thioesterase II family protein n=1 Tax=Mesorhizobium sp. 131-2-5 TaxID=2744519 RepID=UPI001FD0FD59|nr:thioesterase domain-containing protein [Mesorhizobium sp. 131-2-5]
MPGRSARLEEGFWMRMEDMVDGIVPQMLPFLKEKPFAFIGFCYGGVQAFEVAQRVRRDQGLEPEHFFVAGGRSPQIYRLDRAGLGMQPASDLFEPSFQWASIGVATRVGVKPNRRDNACLRCHPYPEQRAPPERALASCHAGRPSKLPAARFLPTWRAG